MSTPSRGLGRGLSALIPPATTSPQQTAAEAQAGILAIPVTDIAPNPRQPRSRIETESLAELAASIREHGLIQPLIVTRGRPADPTPYQLIAGERRWRAAQLAGLKTVPALLKEATPQQALELALVENIQRADLNALEEAAAYQALMADFGLSQHQVADRVGKSRAAVANAVRLLRLPEPVKGLLADGVLSEGHGRALLGLPDDEVIVQAAEQVVARELNVRQTEELVRRLAAVAAVAQEVAEDAAAADDPDASHTHRLEEAFRGALGTKVTLSRGRRGGRLVIHFYSDEELQAIYEQIVGDQ
ncbi:MAG: ParB/RepB/Spo0J family partition protein [Chloroflexi bacterium]|nr:ParB/RepB/Spo0J family partition protein [Chloroflexota bacterium]